MIKHKAVYMFIRPYVHSALVILHAEALIEQCGKKIVPIFDEDAISIH